MASPNKGRATAGQLGDKAIVARIRVGVTGTDDVIQISEHWEVKDGQALSIWVAYFESKALLDKLGL